MFFVARALASLKVCTQCWSSLYSAAPLLVKLGPMQKPPLFYGPPAEPDRLEMERFLLCAITYRDQRRRNVRHANMSSARGNDRSLRTYELYAVLYSTQKRIRKRGNIPERSTLFFLKSHLEWRKLVLGLGDGVERKEEGQVKMSGEALLLS